MRWGAENPCFGCKVKLASGERRRSPCCWKILLALRPTEREDFFIDASGANPPLAPQICLADDDSSSTYVAIDGPCPRLNRSTGKCLIQSTKPLECRLAPPGEFFACAQMPNGRWNQFLEEKA